MGNTNGLMDESTRESGKTIRCMVRVHSLFLTVDIIKGHIEMIKRMEEEFTSGQMDEGTKENFIKVNSMELVLLFQKMENKE